MRMVNFYWINCIRNHFLIKFKYLLQRTTNGSTSCCSLEWKTKINFQNAKYSDLNKQNLQAYKVFGCDVEIAWKGMEQAYKAH